jgi:hypothetical protein
VLSGKKTCRCETRREPSAVPADAGAANTIAPSICRSRQHVGDSGLPGGAYRDGELAGARGLECDRPGDDVAVAND